MIPVTVSSNKDQANDPNWAFNEFMVQTDGSNEIIKFDEHKSKGDHSKLVYDWEILELFFRHHNLNPNYYDNKYDFQKVKMTHCFFALLH